MLLIVCLVISGAYAGMYANIDCRKISLFYPNSCERVVVKLNLDDINSVKFAKEIAKLAAFIKDMSTSEAVEYLMALVRGFAKLFDDVDFMRDIRAIDDFLED